MARAIRNNVPISRKSSVEICKHIRGKYLYKAITIVENAIGQKVAIPYKRYTADVGHKVKMGPGRYPGKACEAFLEVLKELEANAKDKSLDVENLVIKIANANKGPTQGKYGRSRGKVKKNTHLEIIVESQKPKEETAKKKKRVEKTPKKEIKESTVKEVKKE